jgi:serine/threonine-protein kinase RsbW
MTFPAVKASLEHMHAYIQQAVRKTGADEDAFGKIELASEEALVNIIHYAYPQGTGNIDIEYSVLSDPARLQIVISDNGVPFNPLLQEEPDISLPVEERPIGGLGIFLMKQCIDRVDYRHEKGRNILTFLKCL